DLDGQRLRPEARALARGAVAQGHVVLQLLPDLRGQRLLVAPLEDGHGALEAVARLAVQDDVAGLPGQLSPGGLEIELVTPGQDPSTASTCTTPSARRSAVSSESLSRDPRLSRMTRRSTTTSMVCFLALASSISSESSRNWPFTRTRT